MFRGRFKRSFELLNFTPDHLTQARKFELLSPSALVDFRTGSGLRAYIEFRVHTSCLPVVPQHLQSETHLAQENLRDFDGIIDVGNDLSRGAGVLFSMEAPKGENDASGGVEFYVSGVT